MNCPAPAKERKLARRGSRCGGHVGHFPIPKGFTAKFVGTLDRSPEEPDGMIITLCARCKRWIRYEVIAEPAQPVLP